MSVQCARCGMEWPRDPALEVPCPCCRALVGQKCRRPSAHAVFGGEPHAARDQAALDAGFFEKCSGREDPSRTATRLPELPLFAQAS